MAGARTVAVFRHPPRGAVVRRKTRRNGAPGDRMAELARLAAASGVGYVGGWSSACRSAGRCCWHWRPIVYLRFRNYADQTSISQSAGAARNGRRRLAGATEKRRVVCRFRCARRITGTGRRNRESVRFANDDLWLSFENEDSRTGRRPNMLGRAAMAGCLAALLLTPSFAQVRRAPPAPPPQQHPQSQPADGQWHRFQKEGRPSP